MAPARSRAVAARARAASRLVSGVGPALPVGVAPARRASVARARMSAPCVARASARVMEVTAVDVAEVGRSGRPGEAGNASGPAGGRVSTAGAEDVVLAAPPVGLVGPPGRLGGTRTDMESAPVVQCVMVQTLRRPTSRRKAWRPSTVPVIKCPANAKEGCCSGWLCGGDRAPGAHQMS